MTFVSTAAQVDYSVCIDWNRSTYAGRFKGWRAAEDHHHLHVPSDWRVRVERRGLAIVDGMMTLDAHALEPLDGVAVFAATWARQARGFAVAVDRGYIARVGNTHYHARSIEAAIAGVRRKQRVATGETVARRSSYSLTIDEFVRRYLRYDITVTLDDARETGSCEFGIRSWCDAVGLDYEAAEAPMAAVLAGFRRMPMIEVRRAVMHAVREHRRLMRKTQALGGPTTPANAEEEPCCV